MAEILILGGGIAGLSAAWHARQSGREAVLFESRERSGGLLDNFQVDGFRFDNAVHFGFSNNDAYRAVLEKTDYITHRPEAYNYEGGRWLKHPVQNNLYPLPPEEKVEAIKSFVERPAQSETSDYRQWLKEQFGEVIAERFPVRYTEKYWTVPAENLSTLWIGNRLYRPSLEEVLYGAMTDQTPSTYYLPELFYPRRGGFRAFIDPLLEGLDLRTGKEAVYINLQKKYALCRDGTREYYEHLVSSVPLPELIEMLDEVPGSVQEAAGQLWATSIALVSLGFNAPKAGDYLWFYIYDSEIPPSRVHAPYRKSADNVPPGCSSLQFETYFSRYKPLQISPEQLVEQIIKLLDQMKLVSGQDIMVTDYRVLPYANVVFDRGMIERRDYVLKHLETLGITPIGRFGEWDYLWTDQCFLSGQKVEKLPAGL